ncbi:amidohydrolase family protein [Meiothermus granaticius]|uniref:Amidohydrolase n=1 Tax=Meiothermus granaticius NBRC 107808 TaxID=1227551 RepID=A0A399F2Z0_9DEIN|nr:amidohydrolase family protein [Meiothermus granaticius]RIH91107.1 Amidohydrolase [Meiothermus granaticius NBRC 107808]GEM87487.1 amidohydrolase [Meiothermus granaticius NBRC 107808]
MVIDAHQHFLFPSRVGYPWLEPAPLAPLRRDFGPEELGPLLRQNRVDRTLLVQTRSSLEETLEFLRIAAEVEYVAGVVGWADLTHPRLGALLDELLASGPGRYLVGLRHQVHDEPDPRWLLQDRVQQNIAELGQRGLAYDFLSRSRELPACLETARNHPEVRFVLDHLAKPNIAAGEWAGWLEGLAPLAELPNVWVKLSGLVTEADWQRWTPEQLRPYVLEALRLFGPQRCLFGSDWPVCTLAASYTQVKGTLETLLGDLSPAEREGIFGLNAAQVYGLSL